MISGERLGGVGCGTVVSNSSDRRSVENVRFASSAANYQTKRRFKILGASTHSFENEVLREESAALALKELRVMRRHGED